MQSQAISTSISTTGNLQPIVEYEYDFSNNEIIRTRLAKDEDNEAFISKLVIDDVSRLTGE